MKKLAERLAFWADRLRDISAMGLHFARSSYDKEHYEAVQSIAMEMLAVATSEPLEELEPLRAPVFSRPTPLAVGDAAVIDETGRILLVQRADNKKWAMPGGALVSLPPWWGSSIHASVEHSAVIICITWCCCVSLWMVGRGLSLRMPKRSWT
jgi:hypothetical protein